jgi:bifunctional enzyme CysN/CysC
LECLERFTPPGAGDHETVFQVQYVQRVPGGGRRYLGSLVAGALRVNDTVRSPRYPGKEFTVVELIHSGGPQNDVAGAVEISIGLDVDVDIERGDVLTFSNTLEDTDQFEADLVWLDENPGFPGRSYLLRLGHATTKATITRAFQIGEDGEKAGGVDRVESNAVVRVNIEANDRISLSPFHVLRDLGKLVLVDADSGNTVAAGIVKHSLRRADNLVEYDFAVSATERSALTGRQGQVAWFTGLSGSGKSTLVNTVSVELTKRGVPHSVLDGDTLRLGLNKDLGFTESDRVENIRRTAEVAKLMADSGLIVLVSLISPYRADRQHAREIVGDQRFQEVFVDTPLEICEQRDPKGLYQKARQGLIPNFTGIDSPYEEPQVPDVRISHMQSVTDQLSDLLRALDL